MRYERTLFPGNERSFASTLLSNRNDMSYTSNNINNQINNRRDVLDSLI